MATVDIKTEKRDTVQIGVLSDTHGFLRDEVVAALQGMDLIIHAGDVGSPDILDALEEIAPVVAVRGNMDRDDRPGNLPKTEMIQVDSGFIYVLHNLYDLDLVPEAADVLAVVSGHTHKPSVAKKNGVLFLNPGGAGHRRFNYPITVAVLVVGNSEMTPRIIEFDV